ncbi:hypothetical protein [Streptomyces kanamyceticus]|uniref:Uncharacterized protein n=1 Tax=Streptomyces kanamyceticus TaxID=1967 RepID=A0A5J6GN03_STRKN|nr:hypothetical protein [Streptomyces kanamyceticus]QEU96637.1 hypothetical protein CP970_41920 [Streptomyces kanamyceticus]
MNSMSTAASTVSVDEVRTQVSTVGAPGAGATRPPGIVPGAAEAGWCELRGRLAWVEARTHADGFDD